ncbi:tRNA 5-methoxyuridine(34)/uridine 5-oxyacetic acid(34) synthase CmoB [Pseudoteredinibacter isoporae]|uniref:tRNA U34 carboxymethyltransferase n=1 Tax=Pseudoteredinibacter isoporae TaxID=570281 RepID=A0A7X0MYY3_9GAMM|nr:tRNA 5-methoxyuridine(34)/uridine 5-oxyacetic acid(34) synthase CmoB [Pseudoteredinibacter isoporae]MBB6523564.1 tRNA (mo5U34)-methyltransferase [Pseudoteredinibacter isoporae]NHO89072.1 tRNA 5-methoxyuridine(34)/uridine 5-oxyacetic acid(34) synthase CmoB [Pseudoteredinibacter isoporae]NIB22317.1 tRNA 5-methoxyuridine(34)/uridine 5-oxyacetic acid(34) synthase CmoB [Pseudoteredinibacter isoporae]
MIEYYQDLLNDLADGPLAKWAEKMPEQIAAHLNEKRYGDLPKWQAAMDAMPNIQAAHLNFKNLVHIGEADEIDAQTQATLEEQLRALIPWRKGPYQVFDTFINTEWRSDWKWERVLPHLAPLKNRTILDVGCGNGYHCWRMLGEEASRVIGIDPSPRFVVQFYMLKKLIGQAPVDLLPIGIEELPENLQAFDTTFSMGVLYHRRSPMDHLRELKATLKPGGQLVLETLVIDGALGDCLVPEGRYAMMNNVWFLPSTPTLLSWMTKCGFKNPRVVDENITSLEEQRSTDWMLFHSLNEFLDPNDQSKTAEGHPAPRRAVLIAEV